ncbi:uncharacterized protein LOC143485601 [Brachyhypopomus gauderio]|uniref:uncharacterized protein LOC143485601 n=1 Tax=Brachyhypopomus gauderio TaxID=698409 RepID=UPI0040424ABC
MGHLVQYSAKGNYFASVCFPPFTLLSVSAYRSHGEKHVLISRRRVRDQQTEVEAAAHTDTCDGHDREPFALDEGIFETLHTPIRELRLIQTRQGLDRAHRMFAFTFSRMGSSATQVVEVKLQHKSIYSGLESEHWWVLNNDFYWIGAELTLHHFASASAVACIKLRGSSITDATIYLRTCSTTTSVQNIFLQTVVSTWFKGVSIGSDDIFRSSESSHTQTLETPNPAVFSSSPSPPRAPPQRPPPGF